MKDNAIEVELRHRCSQSPAGTRLPSVRELQHRFGASPLTVQRVLVRLAREGLLVTRPGDGTFTVHRRPATANADTSWQAIALGRAPHQPRGLDHLTIAPTPALIDLESGFPSADLQAHSALARAAARAAKRADAWERCLPEGDLDLRTWLAADLEGGFDADDVLITPGAQAAIDAVMRGLLRAGDRVAIEEPGYPGAVAAAVVSGLEPVPLPTDTDGVIPAALDAVLERSGARLAVLQPRHANPTGASLSFERRAEVLEIARRRGVFILEDDWVRDLDIDGLATPPLIADDGHGHVIHVRSFSKSTAPGIRLAAVTARGPVRHRLRSIRLFSDFFVPPLLQHTLLGVLDSPAWPRQLALLRHELAARRDALVTALSETAPALTCRPPRGGVALWARLPDGADESEIVTRCAAAGVRLGAGRNFWLSEPADGHLRVTFASAPADVLRHAAERLGRAIDAA